MENMNPIYRVCYLYNTTPAMEKIFTMAKGCWGETWTEETVEEWIEDFKDEHYDEFNGTWIEKDEIDMDMSMEGC